MKLARLALAFIPCVVGIETDSLYKCHCTGSPVIKTYDDALILVEEESKMLLSMWDYNKTDHCKFNLHGVTKTQYYNETGELFFDWIAFGFDVHRKQKKKFERNIILGQTFKYIAKRGRGFTDPVLHRLPYSYTKNGMNLTVAFNQTDNSLRLENTACQYKLAFYPSVRESWFSLLLGPQYQDGHLEGLCGDCNGNKEDDLKTCPMGNEPGYIVYQSKTNTVIVKSCQDGQHQGKRHKSNMNRLDQTLFEDKEFDDLSEFDEDAAYGDEDSVEE